MKTDAIQIRCNPFEREQLAELASRLGKNRSEVVRDLVREALAILREADVNAVDSPSLRQNPFTQERTQ